MYDGDKKMAKKIICTLFLPLFRLEHCYICHRLNKWFTLATVTCLRLEKKAILLGRHILPRFTTVSNILSQMWSRPYRMSLCWILQAFNLFADIKVTLIELYFWCQYPSKFTFRKLQVDWSPPSVTRSHWISSLNHTWTTEDFSSPA